MPEEISKYASNQFLVVTERSFPLMGELLNTTKPRITAAAVAHPEFDPIKYEIVTLDVAWDAADLASINAEAAQKGATAAFEDKMAGLTRKPDIETNSPIETWDSTIRSQIAYGGSVYTILLPNGRETLTAGDYDAQLTEIGAFATRLAAQGTALSKPVLNTLASTVNAWKTAAANLRSTQITRKTEVTTARDALEDLRVQAAATLFAMVGLGMNVFRLTPAEVDSLFVVGLLRGPARAVPAPPADTLWTPAQRRLSTTALPADATRLEAWRQGPGGAPELLAVGEREALEVTVPAEFTFDPGDLYQLWLQARNSLGTSAPGPKQSWTP